MRILKKDILTEWEGRDARTITAREVIERCWTRSYGNLPEYVRVRLAITGDPSETELTTLVTRLQEACRSKQKQHVLMLLLLTLQRRSELGLAEWKEFDFEAKTWRIPDEHAKESAWAHRATHGLGPGFYRRSPQKNFSCDPVDLARINAKGATPAPGLFTAYFCVSPCDGVG